MIGSMDGKNSMHTYRRLSLPRYGSFDAVGTEGNFRILVTLQHFAVHLAVTHSAAAVATLGIHHDRSSDFARSGIELQRTLLQAEGSANRVQHVAEREVDRGVLRIELKYQTLRGRRDAGDHENCNYNDWPEP